MLRIIRIVVNGRHRRELVKAFDQHTFGIHIGKSQRSLQRSHSPLAPPGNYGIDQSAANGFIIDKVYPAKAHGLRLPSFVGTAIDDGRHASYEFSILISQKIIGFAEIESRILLRREGLQHILVEVGDGIRIVFIKFVIKADKLL